MPGRRDSARDARVLSVPHANGRLDGGRMRWRGLEPPRPKRPLGPQPSASTNSATSALRRPHCSAVRSGWPRRGNPGRVRRPLAFALLLFAGAGVVGAPAASPSERLADVNITGVSLQVNDRSEALVTYTTSAGVVRHVLAWGAVNATPPDP